MKALVLTQYGKLEYKDVPKPHPGPEDVLVKVMACSICGSDVHGMDGSTGRRVPPVIMGHEASGVIEDKGEKANDFSIGDRVTFDSTIYCGKCFYCRKGEVNLCESRTVLGVSCREYRQDGAFAQYVAVPQRVIYRLPDEVSFERAAMVEPLSVALHAVNSTPVCINDTAVVMGAGTIGLLIIQLLRIHGCGKIIVADIEQNKLDLALKLGATSTLRADKTDVKDEVMKATGGTGADIVLEAVGVARTVRTAVFSAAKGGSVTLVGNVSPEVEFPLQTVVTREISLNGSCGSSGEYDRCLDLIAKGVVDVDVMISREVPLRGGAQWFEKLYNRERGLRKVVLKPWDEGEK